MAKLPTTIKIDATAGLWLKKRGSCGSEALAYLPVYNPEVRDYYSRKGFVLLSEASGDNGIGSAMPFVNRPPTDEKIQWAIEQMASRLDAQLTEIRSEITDADEFAKDSEGDERRLYRRRGNELRRRLKDMPDEIPTFQMLKLLSYRIHRAMISEGIDPAIQRNMSKLAESQQWGEQITMLADLDNQDTEVETSEDGEAVSQHGQPAEPVASS